MPVAEDLAHQAVDATTGHAQCAAPSPEQVQQIVNFETQIFTAQTHDDDDEHAAARRAIARGQNLFNTLKIPITGVAGLNDILHTDTIDGFCGTCHDSPNVGDHSVPAPLNIGLVDGSLRTPDLPIVTVMCNSTGVITQVTDIGRAMVTGKCADIGKFKGPILRGWQVARHTFTMAPPRRLWTRSIFMTPGSACISRSRTKTIWSRF